MRKTGPAHRGRTSRRRVLSRIASAVAAIAVLLAGAVTAVTVSAASALGAGFNSSDWIGNWVAPNGTRVYCIDVAQDSAASGGPGRLVTGVRGVYGTRALSGQDLQRLNYAITKHGQTADPTTAAAVNAYVWSVTSSNHPGDGVHYIRGKAPSGVWSAVEAVYWSVRNDTETNYMQGQMGTGTGLLAFTVDGNNSYLGRLELTGFSAPAGTTGTITLTNGVFANGSATLAGVSGNGSWAVRGTPPADGSSYKISAEGVFGVTVPGPYAANITLYSDEIQRAAGPGTREPGFSQFTLRAADPTPRSPRFAPVLSTTVGARYLEPGDVPTDVLTVGVEVGRTPWFKNAAGQYIPVKFTGKLYGPLDHVPAVGESTSGLPVAATASVTTSINDGPNVRYTATADRPVSSRGYYSWEWEGRASAQPSYVQALLRDGWVYVDRFGQASETHLVLPSFWTEATPQSTPGSTTTDTLKFEGVLPQSTEVKFSAYHQQAGVDGTFTAPVCDSTNRVYESPWTPVSEAAPSTATFPLTMDHRGRILWVAEVVIENRNYVAHTGVCGDPQEVTLVTVPEIVTDALDQSVPGSTARDSVTVTGFLAPEGVDVTFAAFRQDDPDVPVCAPENQVWASSAATHLSEEGTGWSEDFRVSMEHMLPGSKETWVFWQETAKIGDVVVHVGECGAPDERTLLTIPEISTDAEPFATPFSTVRDNLSVAGFFPPEGLTVKYRAYLQPAPGKDADPDVPPAPVCEPQNLVIEGDEHHLTGEGEFVSEDFAVAREHVGTLFWSEIVSVAGTVIHEGVCGAPTEITKVEFPSFVTEAAQGFVGEDAYDVATVTGLVPDGAYLTFEAFWAGQGDELVQSAANLFNPSWKDKKFPVVGKSTAPVGQLANDQQLVVQSDGELVTRLGRVQWVAHLWAPDGTLISSGSFDDPAEMTVLKRSRVKGIIDGLEYSGSSVNRMCLAVFVGLLLAAAFLAAAFIAWRRRRV